MGTNKRLTAVLALIFALALLASACGREDAPADEEAAEEPAAEAEEPVRIGFFMLVRANSYTEAMLDGIEEVVGEHNATVRAFDANFEATRQLNQIQDATATGNFDAFIIHAVDANAVVTAVEDAINAGIKVVAVDNPLGPDLETLEPQIEGLTSTVAYGFLENGVNIGRLIVQACEDKDPCQAGYIGGSATVPVEVVRLKGIHETVSDHPNVDIVTEQEGADYLRETGLRVAQDILQAHPNLDVLVTSGDQMTLGAEQAVQEAGRADQVALIGNGGSEPGVEAVREGRWFATTALLPRTEGLKAAEIAIMAVRGETVEPFVRSDLLSPIGELITQDTITDDFDAEWEG